MEDEKACQALSEQVLREVVADKGYHSNEVLKDQREREIRTYISEPSRGRRHWEDKLEEREAVYGNRRRIRGERGKRLMRRRGELVERSFAHCYDTGGMRRTHLRKHDNILKRLLIHVAGFNLSLVLRKMLGLGTARGLQGLTAAALRRLAARCAALWTALRTAWIDTWRFEALVGAIPRRSRFLARLAA
jgi:transposase